jgi:hypothetical protein
MQDGRASDPMHTACDIMQLNGLVRVAVSLVKGIEIGLRPASAYNGSGSPQAILMEMAVFSVVGWFKVRLTQDLVPRLHCAKFVVLVCSLFRCGGDCAT